MSAADTKVEFDDECRSSVRKASSNSGGSGSPLYALGVVGALVWFWQRAGDEPGDRVMAVLKALVWPAILVHDAFEALSD